MKLRKFADLYPAIEDRCNKYTAASKWQNVQKMTPELAKLWVQQVSLWTRRVSHHARRRGRRLQPEHRSGER